MIRCPLSNQNKQLRSQEQLFSNIFVHRLSFSQNFSFQTLFVFKYVKSLKYFFQNSLLTETKQLVVRYQKNQIAKKIRVIKIARIYGTYRYERNYPVKNLDMAITHMHIFCNLRRNAGKKSAKRHLL